MELGPYRSHLLLNTLISIPPSVPALALGFFSNQDVASIPHLYLILPRLLLFISRWSILKHSPLNPLEPEKEEGKDNNMCAIVSITPGLGWVRTILSRCMRMMHNMTRYVALWRSRLQLTSSRFYAEMLGGVKNEISSQQILKRSAIRY